MCFKTRRVRTRDFMVSQNCVLNQTKNSSKRVFVHQRGTKNLKNLQLKASVHAKPLSTLCWCSFACLLRISLLHTNQKLRPFHKVFAVLFCNFLLSIKAWKERRKIKPCHAMVKYRQKWCINLLNDTKFLFSLILFLPLLSMIAV